MLQVTWEPYADGRETTLPFRLSTLCGNDTDIYRMKCPLIYFYAVEWHLPARVACQFGVRQLWPPELFPTRVDLHKCSHVPIVPL
jgi:hypothetical protein